MTIMKLNVILFVITFTATQAFLNSAHAAMNSEDWADVLDIVNTLGGGESTKSRKSDDSRSTQSAPEPRSQNSLNTSGSSKSSGFEYDNYDHTNCISVNAEKRSLVYKNGCSYPIYMQFCQVTDDSDSYSRFQDGGRCPGGWGGTRIQANSSYNSPAWNDFNKYRFFMYACKDGWSPVNENRQNIFLINESWLCRRLK